MNEQVTIKVPHVWTVEGPDATCRHCSASFRALMATGSAECVTRTQKILCQREIIKKSYLGDGAYAQYTGFDIRLTTSDGISVTNEVALGPDELHAFLNFVNDVQKWQQLITGVDLGALGGYSGDDKG